MIGISTMTADTQGDVVIYESPGTDMGKLSPRVSRSATLDGGCEIVFGGFSHGDRTFNIRAQVNSEQKERLENIAMTRTLIMISTPEGVFSGAIENMEYLHGDGDMEMTLLIKEKLGV